MVFKKFRLLGYYPTNRARLKKETEYPQEAKELSSLLTIVRYKIIRYKKFMPPDKPLYQ